MTDVRAPRIGIAPDSWGVWNPVDPAQPDPQQYLDEVPRAGFHWTELGPYGYLGTDPHALRDAFSARDLALSGGTVFTWLHRGGVDEVWHEVSKVADLVSHMGAGHVITLPEMWERDPTGSVIGNREFSTEEWEAFYRGHDAIGKRLWEEYGLRQQFHSHAEAHVGSYREIVRLLENTDPDYTNLCLDTGHVAYYFGDNLSIMSAYPSRIGYLHLKQVDSELLAHVLKNDISFARAVAQGVMVEPPQGTPAYGPILAQAAQIDPDMFAIIEQDMYPLKDFRDPLQIATRTNHYIKNCGTPVRFR